MSLEFQHENKVLQILKSGNSVLVSNRNLLTIFFITWNKCISMWALICRFCCTYFLNISIFGLICLLATCFPNGTFIKKKPVVLSVKFKLPHLTLMLVVVVYIIDLESWLICFYVPWIKPGLAAYIYL